MNFSHKFNVSFHAKILSRDTSCLSRLRYTSSLSSYKDEGLNDRLLRGRQENRHLYGVSLLDRRSVEKKWRGNKTKISWKKYIRARMKERRYIQRSFCDVTVTKWKHKMISPRLLIVADHLRRTPCQRRTLWWMFFLFGCFL